MARILVTEPEVEALADLVEALIDEDGKEWHSTKKFFIEGMSRPLTLTEQIDRVIANRINRRAQDQGFETMAEADDFNVGEDFDVEPVSNYEIRDMVDEVPIAPVGTDGSSGSTPEPPASGGDDVGEMGSKAVDAPAYVDEAGD